MVAGGGWGGVIGDRDEYTYCGAVNIDTDRTYFFLGKINDLEVDASDVGNSYLHEFIKYNIYTVTVP